MSAPAPASEKIWARVPLTSAVLVVVIDWTVTGAPPPTATEPTWIWRVVRRGIIAVQRRTGGAWIPPRPCGDSAELRLHRVEDVEVQRGRAHEHQHGQHGGGHRH